MRTQLPGPVQRKQDKSCSILLVNRFTHTSDTDTELLNFLKCLLSKNYLSKLPVKLHSLGFGIIAFDEPGPAVHIHQASVVIIVDSGTENTHMELLIACVINILQQEAQTRFVVSGQMQHFYQKANGKAKYDELAVG